MKKSSLKLNELGKVLSRKEKQEVMGSQTKCPNGYIPLTVKDEKTGETKEKCVKANLIRSND